MSEPGTELAVADTPRALVKQYQQSFADVLPSHIRKPETWVRIAQGALKKGKRTDDGRFELEVAATNNPNVFLASLLDAARLGLEPGTEQYYLTPRKVKGRLEILGIIGYQGYIELMYRAGAISSVVAECVYTGDEFEWSPGSVDTHVPPRWQGGQEFPYHRIDWDAPNRGKLRLVYAYARMKDGAVSKVVVLNEALIARIKAKSQGANSEYSPWQTNPDAMWLKSAVRQLAKWVPTSAEYRNEQVQVERERVESTNTVMPHPQLPDLPHVSALDDDDELDADAFPDDDEITDAEVVDPDPDDDEDDLPPAAETGEVATDAQVKAVNALLRSAGHLADARFTAIEQAIGVRVTSTKDLTKSQASALIDALQPEGAPA